MARHAARDARLLVMSSRQAQFTRNQFLHLAQLLLAEEHFLADEESGRTNAPRSTADCVFSISFALTSGSCHARRVLPHRGRTLC